MELSQKQKYITCLIGLIMAIAMFVMPIIESLPFYDAKGKPFSIKFDDFTKRIVDAYVIAFGVQIFLSTIKAIIKTEIGQIIISIISFKFARNHQPPTTTNKEGGKDGSKETSN